MVAGRTLCTYCVTRRTPRGQTAFGSPTPAGFPNSQSCDFNCSQVLGWDKEWAPGLVNFVPNGAYYYSLALPVVFTQPGACFTAEPCTKFNRHERRYFQQDGWAPYHSFPLPIISSRASSDGRVFLLIAASRSPNADPVGVDPAFLLGPLRSSRRSPCCDSCVSFRSRESLWSIMDYRAGLKKGVPGCEDFSDKNSRN